MKLDRKSGEKVGVEGSAEERIEIFGEEMETFPNGSRFLFVRAAVSCRPAG